MSEFQMTHVALVGARPEIFAPLGVRSRAELTMRRALPALASLQGMDLQLLRKQLAGLLPVWVHNAISAPDFPGRDRLLMHLRRFEGELRDKRENEVIASVITHGFRNRQFDPLALPESMPIRQRCNMLMHITPWQEAYQQLEAAFVAVLVDEVEELDKWLTTSQLEIEDCDVTV
jgi:hypothetical protein